jgi:hypothetical protein
VRSSSTTSARQCSHSSSSSSSGASPAHRKLVVQKMCGTASGAAADCQPGEAGQLAIPA